MEKIAVIGMSCFFPKARNISEYLNLLRQGRSGIGFPPKSREMMQMLFKKFSQFGINEELLAGYVPDFDYFDESFFALTPREAKYIDPQQRLLLQSVWHAFENSYLNPQKLINQNIGVFVGVMGNEWADVHINQLDCIDKYTGTGNGYCLVANRISYHYQFHGPSMAIDTACSSSLVAIKHAVTSLQLQECNMAVAAGVNFILTPGLNLYYQKVGLLSKEGTCKSFGCDADGIGRGEGVATVVLQRLSDAVRENRRIYAVIEGVFSNHNGLSNGIMAPNRSAQARLLKHSYHTSGIDPKDITFIEAHGTGTLIGDPIEVNALKDVIGCKREASKPCSIGSVKSNISHLEGAAGIAGFIKAVLGIYHQQLFPSLHSTKTNPYSDFSSSGLYVQQRLEPIVDTSIIIAGVSSFGLGGTNAHIILSNNYVKSIDIKPVLKEEYILKITAHQDTQLSLIAQQYYNVCKNLSDEKFYEFCTVINNKADFKYRRALSGSKDSILLQLASLSKGNDLNDLSINLSYKSICEDYQNALSIEWSEYYPINKVFSIDMPLYPFIENIYEMPNMRIHSIFKQFVAEESISENTVEKLNFDSNRMVKSILSSITEIPLEKIHDDMQLQKEIYLDSLMLLDLKKKLEEHFPSAKNLNFAMINDINTVLDLVNTLQK